MMRTMLEMGFFAAVAVTAILAAVPMPRFKPAPVAEKPPVEVAIAAVPVPAPPPPPDELSVEGEMPLTKDIGTKEIDPVEQKASLDKIETALRDIKVRVDRLAVKKD